MIYLIANTNAVIVGTSSLTLIAGAKYELSEIENESVLIFAEGCYPLTVNFYELVKHNVNYAGVINVTYLTDSFIFLNPKFICNFFYTHFKFKGAEVGICLGVDLAITINGNSVFSVTNQNLTYSHYEIMGDLCVIHFDGVRKFVAVIKEQEVVFADYYDEVNVENKEYYFLCHLNDSLNHGRVCHIKDGTIEDYLVYLDDYDMQLKPEFLPCVFLDCLVAKNYKYCNALLCESLKQKDAKTIAEFFVPFTKYYPLTDKACVLIKKDALIGICEFEIENNLITNIKFV